MPKKKRHNLAFQSALFFFVIFVPVLVIILFVSIQSLRREVRSEANLIEKNEELLVGFQKTLIANQLSGALEDIRFLASQVNLASYLSMNFDPLYRQLLIEDFLSFLERKQVYGQLRILDLSGMEKLGINYKDGHAMAVRDKNLRPRHTLYYYKRATELTPGTIYVSRLDLSIDESGEIDPEKPLIRFVTPLVDNRDKVTGLLILNFLARNIINRVEEAAFISFGETMLLTPDGFWLYNAEGENEWGFVFPDGQDRRFSTAYPAVWEAITKMGVCT